MRSFFVVSGAGIVLYEIAAARFGWTLVSDFHGWRRVLRDAHWVALWVHYALESGR